MTTILSVQVEPYFMIPCLGFVALLIVWIALGVATSLGARSVFGIIGSLLAALVLGAAWQAEHVPWVWVAMQLVLVVWLGAGVLNGFALPSGRGRSRGLLATTITLGVLGFLLHAAAGIVFLLGAAMHV